MDNSEQISSPRVSTAGALIIFAKQPVPGKVKTRLTPPLSPEETAQLYFLMLSDVVNKTGSLGVDRFLFCHGDQKAEGYFQQEFPALRTYRQEGRDLGERMKKAATAVLAMGYPMTVIIGTDSPDLPLAYIGQAFELLGEGGADVVFGPCEDGGYYLLGFRKIHCELFSGLPWSTGNVLKESLEKAESAGLATSLLPSWHDVDTIEDLARPELTDPENGAPLTRGLIKRWRLKSLNWRDK